MPRSILLTALLAGAALMTACGSTPPPASTPTSTEAETGDPSADHSADHGFHSPHAHQHDFSDVERYAAMFDSPERDAWQRPREVVALMNIEPGMTLVDLGAGTGYFLPHLAAAAPDVHVLALDVEPAMVEHMRSRIAEARLDRVEARVSAPDDPGLARGSVDRILVVNTWHHIEARVVYVAKLHAALRPGGTVVIVDFTMEAEDGPPPAMRLTPEQVIGDLEAGGLVADIEEETLPDQYVVVGRLPAP
jgi:SAM-dependent methyltransferase